MVKQYNVRVGHIVDNAKRLVFQWSELFEDEEFKKKILEDEAFRENVGEHTATVYSEAVIELLMVIAALRPEKNSKPIKIFKDDPRFSEIGRIIKIRDDIRKDINTDLLKEWLPDPPEWVE